MSDDASGSSRLRVAGALFLAIAALLGVDLAFDLRTGAESWHVAVELGGAALALGGAVFLWRTVTGTVSRLTSDLEAARDDATRWREQAGELLRGLGAAIDEQFDRWGLSAAEREVGLLLLKGLSLKEIGRLRGTSERTAREQAQAIYRKGQLEGRSDLAAFFLEDLLLPPAGGA